jgi:hypothetical protein
MTTTWRLGPARERAPEPIPIVKSTATPTREVTQSGAASPTRVPSPPSRCSTTPPGGGTCARACIDRATPPKTTQPTPADDERDRQQHVSTRRPRRPATQRRETYAVMVAAAHVQSRIRRRAGDDQQGRADSRSAA